LSGFTYTILRRAAATEMCLWLPGQPAGCGCVLQRHDWWLVAAADDSYYKEDEMTCDALFVVFLGF